MIDIFKTGNAFEVTTMAAALEKIPYKQSRIRDLKLFAEKPIATTTFLIEERDGMLSIIETSPRGAAGKAVGNAKGRVRPFTTTHLSRTAKVMADEVQGVRMFGSENAVLTIEQKRNEKLALIQAMHEQTWEYHRVGAMVGKVLDADGTTVLLDVYSAFGVTQQTHNYDFTDATADMRYETEQVLDLIDDELGGSGYDSVIVFCGGTFYDRLIKHKFIQDYLKQIAASGDASLIADQRQGFSLAGVRFERARRWKVKNADGTLISMIAATEAYAVPIGVTDQDGPMFRGYFAPQPFLETVNRLNPPLVVKAHVDPMDKFIEMEGVSCPAYINTRPRSVIKLTGTFS